MISEAEIMCFIVNDKWQIANSNTNEAVNKGEEIQMYKTFKPIELESPGCSDFEENLKSFKT